MEQEINQVNETPAAQQFQLKDASAGKRFLNLFFDVITLLMVIAAVNTLYIVFRFLESDVLVRMFDLAVIFAYFWGLESALGQTVGKIITKTKVVKENGEKPQTFDLAIRSVSRFIPFEPIIVKNKRWLHDRLSKTRVVEI